MVQIISLSWLTISHLPYFPSISVWGWIAYIARLASCLYIGVKLTHAFISSSCPPLPVCFLLQQAVLKLIQSLPHCSFLESSDEHKVEEFASHVLNETCTTVTNTAAKTAVQLVFGKANLVFVRPSPLVEDNHSVVVRARQVDSSVSVLVKSSWWLVEDYAAFSMLNRVADPSANLGVVDVEYILEIKLQNFIRDK